MPVASLFSGIGGIEIGLRSGDSRLKPCFFCEKNEDAQTILRHHFPDVPIHDDVTALQSIPHEARVLTAGSPCCDFSIASKAQNGLDGEKSSLMRHVFRILKKSPQIEYVVLENVANVVNSNQGNDIQEIGDALAELGFTWAYRVVDARAFGLRQKRRRIFIIAQRASQQTNSHPLAWVLQSHTIQYGSSSRQLFEITDTTPSCSTPTPLSSSLMTCPDDASFFSFDWIEGKRGCSFQVNVVPTIRAHDNNLFIASQPAIYCLKTNKIGLLSPEDGEVAQGFPRGWTSCIEDKKRFARIGNAVPVAVLEWIGSNLLRICACEIPLKKTENEIIKVKQKRSRAQRESTSGMTLKCASIETNIIQPQQRRQIWTLGCAQLFKREDFFRLHKRRETAGISNGSDQFVCLLSEWPARAPLIPAVGFPSTLLPISTRALNGFLKRAHDGKPCMPKWALNLVEHITDQQQHLPK